MTIKGKELVKAWENRNGKTLEEFSLELGRTPRAVASEIYRINKKEKEYAGANILIFDIETSPLKVYTWGIRDQYIGTHQIIQDWFIISWAAKWLGDKTIMGQVLTPEEALDCDDKRIVSELWELFNTADILVAHNLNRFDKKRSNWRFLFHGIEPPLPYKSIDTLIEVRKYFGATSNKLDYLTGQLGIRQKDDTDFSLWIRCMNGEKSALDEMLSYNITDVNILESTYKIIRSWMTNHPDVNLYKDKEVSRCPVCAGSVEYQTKQAITAANAYGTYRCTECNHVGRTKIPTTTKEQRKTLLR